MKKIVCIIGLAFSLVLSVCTAFADGNADFRIEQGGKAYAVRNIKASAGTVSVSYIAKESATLVIEILDEETEESIQRKSEAVDAGASGASLTFSGLPEGFFIRSWLENSSGEKLSDVASSGEYTRACQEIFAQRIGDYLGDPQYTGRVLDLTVNSGYGDGSFLVVKEDVTLIRDAEHDVTVLPRLTSAQDVMQFQIGAADAAMLLETGRKVLIEDEGSFYLGTVQSSANTGSGMMITLALENGEKDVTDRYVESSRYEYHKTGIQEINFDTPAVKITGNLNWTAHLITGNKEYRENPHSEKRDTHYLIFGVELEMTDAEVTLISPSFSKEWVIVPIPFPGLDIPFVGGLNSDIRIGISFEAEGSLGFHFSMDPGFAIYIDKRMKPYAHEMGGDPTGGLDSFAVKGEIAIGLVTGPRCSFFEVVSVGASLGAYIVIEAMAGTLVYRDEEKDSKYKDICNNAEYMLWHACENGKCVQGDVHFRVGASLGAAIGSASYDLFNYKHDFNPFFWFYHSFTFGTGAPDICPYYGWRLAVRLIDKSTGRGIPGAKISYDPYKTAYKPDERFIPVSSMKTNADGWAVVYIPAEEPDPNCLKPKTVNLSAAMIDAYGQRLTVTRSFTERGYEDRDTKVLRDPEVVLTMDTRRFALEFIEESDPEKVRNMPDTIYWYPQIVGSDTADIKLPPNLPEKPDHLFLGWEDRNSGSLIPPGDTMMKVFGNKRLYASWEESSCLRFRDSGSGKASGIPADIPFFPSQSDTLNIPDTVPTKSGLHFVGWNTAEDGTGDAYMPGETIRLYESKTLYAQWEVISDTYVVIYNPNGGSFDIGGTHTSQAQIVKNGQEAQIISAVPCWEHMTFLGWATTDTADMPEYVYGVAGHDRFKGEDSSVNNLYAVWQYNPVEAIRISYDANGDAVTKAPSPQWIGAGSWLQLSSSVMEWDPQHIFLGWSRDSNARKAEYLPGSSHFFLESTVLYAVWQRDYRIIEGAGSAYVKKSGLPLRFVANGAFRYFSSVRVDDKTLGRNHYAASSGSTVIELKADYLERLKEGKHHIQVVYVDGETDTVSFMVSSLPPKTGDAGPSAMFTLAVLGAALALLAAVHGRKP